jgi:uncharacterized protein (DUF1330 family)
MTAYIIADIEVLDAGAYDEYRQRVPATIAAHGGRYIARGGSTEVLEGTWSPRRCVILEFPTVAQAKAWWNCAEYQLLRVIRERTTRSNVVLIEGL